ncbi:hypothetical protein DXG01_010988 [Tephrocybe rancida]|nr:hypothetical protein DXG01_010988 [Tephrocybe rancida]
MLQDLFAAAHKANKISPEILPVKAKIINPKSGEQKEVLVDYNDGVREGVTVDMLAKLKPMFMKEGSTHLGNMSQVSDGAAVVLLACRSVAAMLGLPIIGNLADHETGRETGAMPIQFTSTKRATEALAAPSTESDWHRIAYNKPSKFPLASYTHRWITSRFDIQPTLHQPELLQRAMPIELIPLSLPTSADTSKFVNFGREVCGVNPGSLDPKEFSKVQQALYKHDVLSFHDAMLTPEQHYVFTLPQVQLRGHGTVTNHEGIPSTTLQHPSHNTFHKTCVSPEDEAKGITRFQR